MLNTRPYQQFGIEWLRSKRRGLLADKPGLGKTLQASEAAELPALVVCPTYLVDQWAMHLKSQYDGITVATAKGTAWKRFKALNTASDWTIANIEMLRNYDFGAYRTLIIDESHRVKNRNAQQSLAAFAIAQRTDRVYELSGTPITKAPDDYFMQLRILDMDMFSSYWKFVDMFCEVEYTPWGDKVTGAKSSLAPMLSNYVLGRDYADVALDLPELISTIVPVPLSSDVRAIYDNVRKSYLLADLDIPNSAVLVQTLRQITNGKDKLKALKELVADLDEPIVIYCWYRSAVEYIAKELKCPAITGAVAPDARLKIARQQHKIIVCTMSSMTEGVDLSYARAVIYYECDYTPGPMTQTRMRVQRWSANVAPVRCYYLLAEYTVDEVVYASAFVRERTVTDIAKECLLLTLKRS